MPEQSDNTRSTKGPKKSGARHRARKRAVDLLFEAEARGVTDIDGLLAERRQLAADDAAVAPVSDYTATLVTGVGVDRDQIDSVISSHLTGWTLTRLPAVDRAIMRIAVWELFNAVDVPPAVVVDEAVELAKAYGTEESSAFVNGVLNRIADDLGRADRDR